MNRVTITRRLTFCAGHRVAGHEGKCKSPHGHNYEVFIVVRGDLDGIGRVVDFGVVKESMGAWLEKYWDHAFLYWVMDQEMQELFESKPEWKSFALPDNPTAENLARTLLQVARSLLEKLGVEIVSVQVQETENCSATFRA